MALAPEIIGSIVGSGTSLLNTGLNALNMGNQISASKELMDYQWKNFTSPQAQVKAMGAAGLNAGALLGAGKGSFASPSVAMPTSSPVQIDGVADMANYLTAVAQAKKAGVDTKNVEVDTQQKKFELELSKVWSNPEKIVNLTSAWKNVMLQNDEHNLNEWKIASEKALSGLKGIERDTAQKILDNMDTQIQQENKQRSEDIKLTQERQKTEKTAQNANTASANASNTQADVNRQVRRLQSALADIEEGGKVDKINSLIAEYKKNQALSEADAKEAEVKLSRLRDLQDKRDSKLFKEVDNFTEWLKSKVSIFH